jgi:hypothetical protein
VTRRPSWGAAFDSLLLVMILIGVVFRFSWTNWNQDADLHPDEYGLTNTLTHLGVPHSFAEYINTRLSPLSPYQKYDLQGNPSDPGPDNRMRWGQWPISIIRVTAELSGNSGYGNMRLWGRSLSALADTLGLLLIFLIGARIYGRRAGLLAAALGALAVMQIQQSHFMTSDNFALLFSTAAMYCAVRAAEPLARRTFFGADWLWYGLFGIAFGMAVASRINLALLAVIVEGTWTNLGNKLNVGLEQTGLNKLSITNGGDVWSAGELDAALRPWAESIGDKRFETETIWKEKLTGGTRSAVEILARELRQGLNA